MISPPRSIFAALVLAFGLCGPIPAFAQQGDPVLDRIKANGAIAIGYRETASPFSSLDERRNPAGYSIDLCMRAVETIRAHLNTPQLPIKWIPVNPQNRIPLVTNGTVDLECGSTVNTLERQKQVDFSYIPFAAATQLLVRKDGGIREVEDLDGKTVALPLATAPERLVRGIIEQKKLNVRVMPVRDNAEGFLALSTGRADAYATDNVLLYGLRKTARVPDDFIVVGRALDYSPYGFMVQKGSSAFLTLVNSALARAFRSGEADQLFAKWFGPLGFPKSDLVTAAFQVQSIPD
ncbi:amino acid ABC transporter substrate-binding protein [Methylobacterium sp. NPDC080182]|uniref:amino acid ABC transporter substrate-binding protein n=1 Tax=Methylobacterium sp. NPDC080182 TaxID=3390590 RepID=UPI003D089315